MISIIIISWKNPNLITKLIELLKKEKIPIELIIIYNGEKSGSPKFHREIAKPIPFNHIKFKLNSGFSFAINKGVNLALGDYILLLNDDAQIKLNTVRQLMESYRELTEMHGKIGAIGPAIINKNGLITNGGRLDFKKYSFERVSVNLSGNYTPVDYVSGEVFFIEKNLFQQFKFKTYYFAYWEETELCMRMKLMGYNSFIVNGLKAFHQGSQSIGKSSPFKYYLYFRNKFWFFIKTKYSAIFPPIGILFYFYSLIYAAIFDYTFKGKYNIIPLTIIDALFYHNRPKTYIIRKLMTL